MATTTVNSESGALLDGATRRALAHQRRLVRWREVRTAYLFLAPNVVVFAIFLAYPIGKLTMQSFQQGGVLGPAENVGLENWRHVFSDPQAAASIRNSAEFALMYVPAVIALALVVALLLRNVRWGGTTLRAVLYLPSIAPLALVASIWAFIVHPEFGLLSVGPRVLGAGAPNWLGDPGLALASVAMLEVWRGIGFWAMLILAALLVVPDDLYAAGRIDGASALRRFWHVTLPGIRVTLLTAIGLAIISALQVFDSVFVLTNGGPGGSTETVGLYVYRSIFESGDPGFAAALSVTLVLLIVLVTALGLGATYLLQARSGTRRP